MPLSVLRESAISIFVLEKLRHSSFAQSISSFQASKWRVHCVRLHISCNEEIFNKARFFSRIRLASNGWTSWSRIDLSFRRWDRGHNWMGWRKNRSDLIRTLIITNYTSSMSLAYIPYHFSRWAALNVSLRQIRMVSPAISRLFFSWWKSTWCRLFVRFHRSTRW